MQTKKYLTVDLGASNGRVLLGSFDGKKISFETISRFENFPVIAAGVSSWNILYLFDHVKTAINTALNISNQIVSISLDTWGLDFSFTDKNNEIIYNPVTYRDISKNDYSTKSFYKDISLEDYFMKTGWIDSPMGPPFYLNKLQTKGLIDFKEVDKFLMIPDIFNYLLTSVYTNEFSIASNSLMLNCIKKAFDEDIIRIAGLHKDHFSKIVNPAQGIAKIKPDYTLVDQSKLIDVVACASHDTASAVCGVPAGKENDWAFVSLGTWCVFGTETEQPILDMDILKYGITNEGISRQRSFLAKNATGLWVIQQCMLNWQKNNTENLSYADIDKIFPKAQKLLGFIDLDDPIFASIQPDMPSVIYRYCRERGFQIENDVASISRCIYESIILFLKYYLKLLADFSEKKFKEIYVFGGGAKNTLFCQWLADALEMPVNVSNPESASVGNLLMQLISDREAKDLIEAREIARNSFDLNRYEPKYMNSWKQAYGEYLKIKKGDNHG